MGQEITTYGKPLSEAETKILGIIDSTNTQFKYTALNPNSSPHESFNVPYNKLLCVGTIGSQPSLDTAVLLIGQNLLEGMYHVHRVCPDIVKNALLFGIDHEASHVEGAYSASHLIRRKYADPESPECLTECEYKANLQAMTNRRKGTGMTFEKLEDEVAAHLWLTCGNKYNAEPYQNVGDAELDWSDYIMKYFPRLGDEFKEQITEKIFEIDREYRKRCKEDVGHNL